MATLLRFLWLVSLDLDPNEDLNEDADDASENLEISENKVLSGVFAIKRGRTLSNTRGHVGRELDVRMDDVDTVEDASKPEEPRA